jgi:phospholipase/carboxylesterase
MAGVVDILTLGVAPDRAKVLCILVHGRGQTPEDMEAAVIRHLSAPDVSFALPRAAGKSWYSARAIDPLTDATRTELGTSLAGLAAAITDLRVKAQGVPLVLAGFSQGACLSLEHAFSGQAAPDAVIAFTGCRVGLAGDERPTSLLAGLPVYLSAASDDPWIPLSAFAEAAVDLGRGGAALRCDVFSARPHEVSQPEIAMLETVLQALSAGRAPAMGAAR